MPITRSVNQLSLGFLACLFVTLTFFDRLEAQIGPGSDIPAIYITDHTGAKPDTNEIYIESSQPGVPLQGAVVKLVFPPEACDLLVLCGLVFTDCPQTFEATTDSQGKARFTIPGGGCWGQGRVNGLLWENETLPEAYLVKVLVNDEVVAFRGVRSTDVVDNAPKTAAQLWCHSPPGAFGTSTIGLSDAVFFTPPYKTGNGLPCADLDGDGDTDLTDAVRSTPAIKVGSTCTEDEQN